MQSFEIEAAPGKVVVSGEVDLDAAPALRDALQRASEGHPPRLVIELSEMTFIDSSGLNELIRSTKQAGRVVLEGTPRFALRLLEMTGVAELFDIS